ncbi:MAG: 30S ribosomal protein S18 [Minisyncoccales bacterium]
MACFFCQKSIGQIDFKNVNVLKNFITALGKIRHRKRTKLCNWHQKEIKKAIKRARLMGLLPFVVK